MTNNNRIALVTGGSRGLGRNMAEALAARGVDVIFTFHSAEAQAAEVVKVIESHGRKGTALQFDVRDVKKYPAFVEQVKTVLAGRKLDILVNNAGTGAYAPFMEVSEEQFDELVNVHLKSTFFLTQRVVPLMNDGGRILNVSSGLARFALPGYSAYATMKGAVETLTRSMARELGARRISVNVIAPGAVATDFGGGHVRDNKDLQAMLIPTIAMGRIGQADDIGPAVAVLTAPELGWMTAQRIELSGGQHL